MLLYRSLAVGLLGAACLLVATRPPAQVRVVQVHDHARARGREVYRPAPTPQAASIVDVAAGLPPAQLGALVHLEPLEHVIAVDDRAVASDLDAGAVLAKLEPHAPAFVDLTIAGGPAGQRRVVMLLH